MTSRVLALTAVAALVVAVFVPKIAGRQGTPPARPQTPAPAAGGTITKGDFRFAYDDRGISSLANPHDPFGATLTTPATTGGRGGRGGQGAAGRDARADDELSRRRTRRLDELHARSPHAARPRSASTVSYASDDRRRSRSSRRTRPTGACSTGRSISKPRARAGPRRRSRHHRFPCRARRARRRPTSSSAGSCKHQFVSGAGSFFYYVRASGAPPFLLVTVQARHEARVHRRRRRPRRRHRSTCTRAKVAGAETRGTWRQPNTTLDLAPPARQQGVVRLPHAVGVELRRAARPALPGRPLRRPRRARHDGARRTSPRASRSTRRRSIESVTAEFPAQTTITPLAAPQVAAPADTHVYEVAFKKLGENMLTITHDGGRKTYLEFFVTEPMETLIKKRAAFLVNQQQIKDPSKWWNGVYGIYDMKAKVVAHDRRPGHLSRSHGLRAHVRRPGPVEGAVSRGEERHVPGPEGNRVARVLHQELRLGRTAAQGRRAAVSVRRVRHAELVRQSRSAAGARTTPSSSPTARRRSRDLDKEHVWRSYDYPHVVMLYFHMYQIAKLYPEMSTYLDARRLSQSRLGDRARVLHLSVRDLSVVLRDVQMGPLQRARRARPHRRARARGLPGPGRRGCATSGR